MNTLHKHLLVLGGLLGLLLFSCLVLWLRSSLHPQVWQPSSSPGLSGVFTANNYLHTNYLTSLSVGNGPEDITFDKEGNLYTALASGDILKLIFDNNAFTSPTIIANTGGRPLGLKFNADGNLIVADAIKGLLEVTLMGDVNTLVDNYAAEPLRFVDHLVIAQSGVIYFSDASTRFTIENYKYDFIEASQTGRVFAYDPSLDSLTLLVDDVFFANGVALSKDERFLLINETGKARILRYDLHGGAGEGATVFVDNLPGLPDNLVWGTDGIIWVALISLRDPLLDGLAEKTLLRTLLGGLPHSWLPEGKHYGLVLGLDEDGRVLHNLQTADGYTQITTAISRNKKLYLGSLHQDHVGVVDIKNLQ